MDAWPTEQERAAHELMRKSLMDRSSGMWAAQPEVCLIWLGTLPSASGRIIEARRQLENLILGPGTLNEFMDGKPFVPPTVLHDKTGHIPDAAAVAVGVGSCATSLYLRGLARSGQNYFRLSMREE